jgi:hypothetical protein
MSRASNLAKAIGADGTLNVSDVAGLAAVASSGSASDLSTGTLPIARIADGAVTAAKLASTAVTDKLGFTPANKAGDTFTGNIIVTGSITANSFVSAVPTNGLKLYWDFAGSGATVADQSGNGNTGTIAGGAYRTTGKSGSGLGINGSGHQVTSSFTAPAGAKTMAFWLKTSRPLSIQDEWRIGFQGNNNGNGFMFMYGVGSIQDLGMWSYGIYDAVPGTSYTTAWTNDGQWHHIAATHDGNGRCYLFRDGVKYTQYYDSNGTSVSYITVTSTLSNTFKIDNSLAGSIAEVIVDNVVVYDRLLSDAEIVQVRDATA